MNMKGIQKRGERTYRFTYYGGLDGDGKQIRKTTTFKVPEGIKSKDIEKTVAEAYLDFTAKCMGNPRFKANMKFSELVDIYLHQYAPNKLKPVTLYNYQRDLELHLLPILGHMAVNSITTSFLSEFFTSMDKASETTRKLRTVLSSVFSFGKSQGYVAQNPCCGALYKTENSAKRKIKFLDKAQCSVLMTATSEYSIVNTVIQFLLFTGLRIGECLGLSWDCVDFENNTITIQNNLSFGYDGWYLSTPKTDTSDRVIKLGGYAIRLLLEHKKHQDNAKAIVGDAWAHPDIIFTSSIGNYFDRNYVNKYLKQICSEHGLPEISVHKLRHTHASLLINEGNGLKAVSSRLGHCNISITADIYGHIFESYEAKMAQDVEKCLL